MMQPLEFRFNKQLLEEPMWPSASKLYVAVSGGVDSVALTRLLHATAQELDFELEIAHVNYGLRAGADKDAAFVEQLAHQLDVPMHLYNVSEQERAESEGKSTQAWARQLRYAWFDALHANQPNAYIATAHHAEDVAETVLLQLMRGRDPQILKGIHVQSGRLRRPLLAYRKQELVDYLQAIDQPWREDPTNAQTDYLRNHIRHKVLPALTEVHPDPVQQLTQRLSDYQEQQTALQYWLDRETDARMSHSTRRFDLAPDVPDANLQLMLEYWLRTYWMATAGEVQSAIQLLKAQKGRHVAFDEHQLIRESDYLIMREAGTPEEFEPTEIDLYDLTIHVDVPHQQQTLTFKESSGVIALYMMDLDKIQWPVTLRVWQAGDRLQKPGVSKPQKVKDLLTAERITTAEKQGALVLEDQQGLIWVQYVDVAARIFFSEDTSTFLTIHENPLQP